jgi:hypothetical protein
MSSVSWLCLIVFVDVSNCCLFCFVPQYQRSHFLLPKGRGRYGASGVYKVVTTAMTFATEEREPEAVVAGAAADDANDSMAPIDVGPIGAKPLTTKRVPKPFAAAPITPDQQASLTALSKSLLNHFSRSHFIMASNILDPTSLVKLLVEHPPIAAAEMRHHQFPSRYVQLASVQDATLSRAFGLAFAEITKTKQLMTLIAAAPGGVLGGAAPAAAVDDAEMKRCLIGS